MIRLRRTALFWLASAALIFYPIARSEATETLDAGPFSVDVSPALTVRLQGVPLIVGDRCVAFRGLTTDTPVLVDPGRGRLLHLGNAFTVLARNGRNTLRREVLVTPEAVHITFELRSFGPTGGSHLQYDLLAPAEALNGTKCTATIGAPRSQRTDEEWLLDMKQMKAGEYIRQSVAYARLALPVGKCSLDFNPQGAWVGEGNYGDPYSASLWHDGRLWHFMTLCSGAQFGATLTGKIILRAGDLRYDQFHTRAPVEYTSDFPVALALDFSERGGDERYAACRAEAPAGKPFRWREPQAVCIVTRPTGGLLYRDFAAPARGEQPASLELDLPPGLYLLSLHVRDDETDTGPFSVTGPEGTLVKEVRVPRGATWVKTVPFRVREGKHFLEFSGQWKVNALTVQHLLGQAEDFLFDRPFWNMPASFDE